MRCLARGPHHYFEDTDGPQPEDVARNYASFQGASGDYFYYWGRRVTIPIIGEVL